jgi:hypothetical protein
MLVQVSSAEAGGEEKRFRKKGSRVDIIAIFCDLDDVC